MYKFDHIRSEKSENKKGRTSWLGRLFNRNAKRGNVEPASDCCSFYYSRPLGESAISYKSLVKDGFYKNAVVYRAISLIAKNVSSVNFDVVKDGKLVDNSAINALLDRPNPKQSGAEFVEAAITYLMLCGNSYIYISTDPLEMQLLRPDRVSIIPNSDNTDVQQYTYVVNGKQKSIFDKSQIIHLKFFNPMDDWYGFSPVQAVAQAVDLHGAVSRHNISLLNSGGRPSGCLVHDAGNGMLNEAQRDRLRDDINRIYAGADNAGKILILDGNFKWQDFGDYTRDCDFNKGKEMVAREIAQAFGVPPMLVGVSGDSHFTNYREARYYLWEDTIIPLAEYFVGAINCWFAEHLRGRLRVKLNLESIPALSLKRDGVWNRISKCEFLSMNEKRRYFGYPDMDESQLSKLMNKLI